MPVETLTREQIVRSTVELLDDEGLEGLNIRELGNRLGSAPTAIYWHVKSKRELITVGAEQVWNELDLPEFTPESWREAAVRMARDYHAMLIRHPWLLQVFGTFAVYGHNRARRDDHNLAIFQAAGFAGATALLAASTVATFALGSALASAGKAALRREFRRSGKHADALIQENIAKFREIAIQFPHLREFVEASDKSGIEAPDSSFEFGLQALLDGLERLLS